MRTSRIARDTARLVEVLSPRRSTRATVQRSTAEVSASEEPDHGKNGGLSDSESALSSVPSDSEDDFKTTSSARKRKRLSASSIPNGTPTSTRVSPRKAQIKAEETPKKAKRQPAKLIVAANGDFKVEPPANWEEIYNLTAEMRSLWQAPVDTMGCESLAEEQRSPRDKRLQTLIALMLSSQTKDTVTAVAMKNLQENLDGGFTLEALLEVSPERLNELISKVGFHNNKTKFIKQTALMLRDQFSSDIPPTIEGLVSLPGVGPKMAYLCMSAAWGRDEGIGVDVHVHRITNLWGWHKTRMPEETRAALEAWLPREKWHDINHLLVGFGQTWCPPVGRKCGECRLAERGLCPSVVLDRKVKRVKKEQIVVKEDGDVVVKDEIDVEVKMEPVNEDVPLAEGVIVPQDIEDIGGRPRRSQILSP